MTRNIISILDYFSCNCLDNRNEEIIDKLNFTEEEYEQSLIIITEILNKYKINFFLDYLTLANIINKKTLVNDKNTIYLGIFKKNVKDILLKPSVRTSSVGAASCTLRKFFIFLFFLS